MQKNYLIAAFEKTAEERFPAQAPELPASMHRRIESLREDEENFGTAPKHWAAEMTAVTSGSQYRNEVHP